MSTRDDRVFDLLVELSDYAADNGLPETAARLEEALDAFLTERGIGPPQAGPVFRHRGAASEMAAAALFRSRRRPKLFRLTKDLRRPDRA